MPYVIINKESESVRLFGSLPSLANELDLDLINLQNNFGRYKKAELTINDYRIVRVSLERSARK